MLRFLIPLTLPISLLTRFYQWVTTTQGYEWLFGNANSNAPVIVGENVIIGNNVLLGQARTPVEKYLFYFWLAIAFLLFIKKITSYQNFLKYIKASWQPVNDPEVLDLLNTISEEKGIRRPLELYTTELISSPLLLGTFKSAIVLPHTNLTQAQLTDILTHELTHYHKKDIFYKWLMQLLLCLHWFNPVVYQLNRMVNQLCEYACDETATSGMDQEARYHYGLTLLEMTRHTGNYREKTAAVTLYEKSSDIQNRLAAMVQQPTEHSYQKSVVFGTLLLLLGLALLFGSYPLITAM